jgi:hypothetical protein
VIAEEALAAREELGPDAAVRVTDAANLVTQLVLDIDLADFLTVSASEWLYGERDASPS